MRTLLSIFMLALLSITFTGETENTRKKFAVELLITCDDENTKAFIESHIKRELRSLHDVKLTNIAILGDYRLSITAIELKSSGRKKGSIAVAYLFMRTFDFSPIWNRLEKQLENDKEMQFLTDNLMWLYEDPIHFLRVGMTDNLDSICKDIVVDFDTEMLEPDRKSRN